MTFYVPLFWGSCASLRYIAAFRYLLALLARLLPVYYRLGLLLLMVLLGRFQRDAGNKTKENTCND